MMELGALCGDNADGIQGGTGARKKVFTLCFYTTARPTPPGVGGRCPNLEEWKMKEAMGDGLLWSFRFCKQ
jgi:hypothetical protein